MSDVAPVSAKDVSRALYLLAHRVRELETEVGKLKRRIAAADKARRKVAAAAREAAIEESLKIIFDVRDKAARSLDWCNALNEAQDRIRALAAKLRSDRP